MTLDQFLERYPQFNNIADTVESELAVSELLITEAQWTNTILRDKAIGELTAHVLSCEYRDMLDVGIILKETEQSTNIRSDIYLDGDSYYDKTIYGKSYLKLLKLNSGGGAGTAMFVV